MVVLAQRRKYPMLSLPQALERVHILFDRERLTQVPVDLIVQHWGYKSIRTGPAGSAYSAVKQFGLIDETGTGESRRGQVSQRARAILTAPDEVVKQQLVEAALEPSMNRLVYERFGSNTGSERNFIWTLVSDFGFSDSGAREFAKQYAATMFFAGLTEEVAEGDEEEEAEESSPAVLRPQRPVESTVDVWNTPQGRVEVPVTHPAAAASRHAIPLVGGKQVILEGEFPITEEAWKGFMTVLHAFKPGLVENPLTAASESDA